ncbi:helix-turn-helix domain-containing protein [Staphylococcus agnetis]|uniref:hypothetical protein n=1 Tax=Staphylococcus agnetis TaxID=985762 RepID=UPI00118A82E3|nr:hypothetical protein [Staphylococcus agnetis]QDW98245.1 hypothetical protein DWB91_03255 [Staphylococcus agnetis]
MDVKRFGIEFEDFLRCLKELGILVEELEKDIGVSKHSLSDWRNGYTLPQYNSLLKLKCYITKHLNTNVEGIVLSKEYRKRILTFYYLIDQMIINHNRVDENEKVILEDHKNNKKARDIVKKLLDFNIADNYYNFEKDEYLDINERKEISRKVKKEYKDNFSTNIRNLVNFIDKANEYDEETYFKCEVLGKNLSPNQVREFYENLPNDDDYDDTKFISSIGSLWLSRELKVEINKINRWKNGESFPSDNDIEKLKKLLNLNGKGAFLISKYQNEDFYSMFLKSISDEAEKRDREHQYYFSLEYFTKVLFFYCKKYSKVQLLLEDIKMSILNIDEQELDKKENIELISIFYKNIFDLKLSRQIFDPVFYEDKPALKEFHDLDDNTVEQLLKSYQKIINKIFSNETITLLESYSLKSFSDEQKEKMDILIDSLKKREGIPSKVIIFNPGFKKLYHHNMKYNIKR